MVHESLRPEATATSTAQNTLGRPEKGAFTALRPSALPRTSTKPIASERIFEVGVFSIRRFSRRSRRPRRNMIGPKATDSVANHAVSMDMKAPRENRVDRGVIGRGHGG